MGGWGRGVYVKAQTCVGPTNRDKGESRVTTVICLASGWRGPSCIRRLKQEGDCTNLMSTSREKRPAVGRVGLECPLRAPVSHGYPHPSALTAERPLNIRLGLQDQSWVISAGSD